MSDSFEKAVDQYLSQQQLPEGYSLEALTLRKIAACLDEKPSAPLFAQFGLTLRNLKKQLGIVADGPDELDDALEAFATDDTQDT